MKIKKEIAALLIYVSYMIAKFATWIDPSEMPEGGWDWDQE